MPFFNSPWVGLGLGAAGGNMSDIARLYMEKHLADQRAQQFQQSRQDDAPYRQAQIENLRAQAAGRTADTTATQNQDAALKKVGDVFRAMLAPTRETPMTPPPGLNVPGMGPMQVPTQSTPGLQMGDALATMIQANPNVMQSIMNNLPQIMAMQSGVGSDPRTAARLLLGDRGAPMGVAPGRPVFDPVTGGWKMNPVPAPPPRTPATKPAVSPEVVTALIRAIGEGQMTTPKEFGPSGSYQSMTNAVSDIGRLMNPSAAPTGSPSEAVSGAEEAYNDEESARAAGKQSGDKVRIKGVGLVQLN